MIRVRTDNGLEKIGEADSSPEMVKAVIDAPFSHNVASGLRRLLIGENPLESDRLWEKMYRHTIVLRSPRLFVLSGNRQGADDLAVILTPDEWGGLLPNPDDSHLQGGSSQHDGVVDLQSQVSLPKNTDRRKHNRPLATPHLHVARL